ncbi:amino acid ABC transporter substrate-binding protein, PAAT family [Desulforamulus reducens MI-1]|uniref:Amino acid ABC transporter substrate-binding protein, PAAT family n=1 Tax=Desulforamulus reducens (strain ATCC BAA-1160 / DSM 100696 / MI-1) TaxID=349161 RepID=A4J2K6_DESRM|nr:basic amino acid ABC transporter substrate-binding protein [Desulforamulus reducens]ABO49309.1 amino acid ABC transporter substrate-binding protein, PAAT family [Desulforamulus reducens MI-1]
MKRIFKTVLTGLTILALALVAVGCTGKEEAKSPAQDTGKKKLVAAADATFAPFEFTDSSGKYVGFDLDLIAAIAEEMGYELEFQSIAFDGIIPALQSSQIDCAATAMTITPERSKAVNFSDPYYKAGQIVVVKTENNDIKGVNDLKGKTIAVQSGTTGAMEAEKATDKKKVIYFTGADQALQELKNGAANAVIIDYPVAAYFIQQGNKDVKLVGDIMSAEEYGIAVPKDKEQILADVNAGLKKIKENGKYAEIYKKWFGEEPRS